MKTEEQIKELIDAYTEVNVPAFAFHEVLDLILHIGLPDVAALFNENYAIALKGGEPVKEAFLAASITTFYQPPRRPQSLEAYQQREEQGSIITDFLCEYARALCP